MVANGKKNGNGNGRKAEPGELDKHALFAIAYIRCNCNGIKAARRAGYTGKPSSLWTQASKLLRTPQVQTILAEVRKEMVMDALECLQRQSEYARGSIEDVTDAEGYFDYHKAKARKKLHLIRELTEEEHTDSDGAVTRRIKVKLYPADTANKTLMTFHGLLDIGLRDTPKDERELDHLITQQLIRIHGEERGLAMAQALQLKPPAQILQIKAAEVH